MNGEVEVKRKNNRGISTCRRRRIKSEGKAKEKSERNKEERKVCKMARSRKDLYQSNYEWQERLKIDKRKKTRVGRKN